MIEKKTLTKDIALRVVKSVFRALTHLRKHNICAACVSPQNVLINNTNNEHQEEMRIALVDFGYKYSTQDIDITRDNVIEGDEDDNGLFGTSSSSSEDEDEEKQSTTSSEAKRRAKARGAVCQKPTLERRMIAAP